MKETQEDWKDMPAAAKIHTFLRERDLMLSVQECDYLAQQILDDQKREIVEAEIERKKKNIEQYNDGTLNLSYCSDDLYLEAQDNDIEHLQEQLNNLN